MARLWLRLYTDVLDSAKLQLLPPEDFRTLINLWCIAKEQDGQLPPTAQLAWRLRCSESDLMASMERLRSQTLLDCVDGQWAPHDWDTWQYPSDSPASAAERKRIQRAKASQRCHSDISVTVTPESQPSHVCLSQRSHAVESESESESESEKSPLPPFAPSTPMNGNGGVFEDEWLDQVDAAADRVTAKFYMPVNVDTVKKLIHEQIPQRDPAVLTDFERNVSAWSEHWANSQFSPGLTKALYELRQGIWRGKPPAAKPKQETIQERILRELREEDEAIEARQG